MKKKVVALLTLAMFVMTLLPVAAFASPTDEATPEYSWMTIEENDEANPTVDVDEYLVAEAHMFKNNYNDTDATLKNAVVWVTEKDSDVAVINATVKKLDSKGNPTNVWDGDYENGYYKNVELYHGDRIGVAVATAGEYTLHVGQLQQDVYGDDVIKEIGDTAVKGNDFTVEAVDEDSMTFMGEGQDGKINVPLKQDPNDDEVFTVTKKMLDATGLEYNGVDTYKITGTLKDEKQKPMKRKDVTLSANKDNLVLEDETVTTDNKGEFDIEFSLDDEVNATITVTYGDLEYTIRVDAGDNDLDNITTTKENGYVLSGKDTKNWNDDSRLFCDAVQFEITDDNGVAVEGQANIDAEPAADKNAANHNRYIKVKKPSKSTLESDDLKLVWCAEDEVYTLKYVGTNQAKDLVEGEYTVTVALKSGNSATATFNVAKFGDVKDLVVKTYYKKGYNNKVATDNEIALGDDLFVEAKYVDENGIEILANKSNVQIGVDGKAVKRENKANPGWYELKDNTTANESLIGTTIKVTAFDSKEKKLATKELTVVDAYKTYSLSFDNKEGKVNVDNNVKVSIVDENGNVAENVKGTVYAYVDSQSNKDAKVTVDHVSGEKAERVANDVIKGKFNIKVYANQPTTADIVVGVKADNGAIYAGTLTYTFGEESIPAGTSVVMTLGSTEMIVNNQLVDMKDAAPFAQDNRTFVPFRALGEALGATVDYDQTAKTVTYKLGSSEIVMTLDSKDYTVNGVKKTMDVAPFAKDNRTYVPVRFVGEGLGFTVTGLTNANGQYVAVAFTK